MTSTPFEAAANLSFTGTPGRVFLLFTRALSSIMDCVHRGATVAHRIEREANPRVQVAQGLSSTMAAPTFAFADYVVLVGFLLLSASIGVYFAWADRSRQSNRTFLTANKQLGWFPVSLSMMASFLSSIAILGLPAEVFLHGSTLWINVLSAIVAISLAAFVFLPIYYKMDITSINEYLELRFKSAVVKDIASGIFILATLLYTGVVLYGPSLALGAVTGIPVSTSILLNGLVCTFYTTIGGIKAVVWTDVVQMALIFVGYIMVIISGVYHVGGITKVWEVAEKGGRITFLNLSVSPYDTYTSWNMFFCWTVVWMSTYCAGQTQLQRYSSIGSFKDARKAVLLNVPGVSITLLLSVITGLVLYAVYSDCDPRLTGDIKKADQFEVDESAVLETLRARAITKAIGKTHRWLYFLTGFFFSLNSTSSLNLHTYWRRDHLRHLLSPVRSGAVLFEDRLSKWLSFG
ncbi:hypothetical protein HPB47_013708 [Ixodes persulcatus]|uniref:Uncharacterized protein n=1 Tax=Ixodes persulcatus TaxID=34615 RepID=A0AC60R0E9_IXOPE|nr:hypothetical protein HPB47_013708 [Ixodes persulcatus]